jgi:phosphoglycolate phosphatase
VIEAPALALFDLDGTLIDSAPDIADAVDSAMLAAGRAGPGEVVVRGFIGHGAGRLIHRVITREPDGVADPAVFTPIYAHFMATYAACLFVRSRVYAGVTETLTTLLADGWMLGLITNKPEKFTAPLLELSGLKPFFEVVLSGDSLTTKKPDPGPLTHAARLCKVRPERVVMVGDSSIDMRAAASAGVCAIAVDYGYGCRGELAGHGAESIITSMSQLPERLDRLIR